MAGNLIEGSVIQRTIVPARPFRPVGIATVPLKEVRSAFRTRGKSIFFGEENSEGNLLGSPKYAGVVAALAKPATAEAVARSMSNVDPGLATELRIRAAGFNARGNISLLDDVILYQILGGSSSARLKASLRRQPAWKQAESERLQVPGFPDVTWGDIWDAVMIRSVAQTAPADAHNVLESLRAQQIPLARSPPVDGQDWNVVIGTGVGASLIPLVIAGHHASELVKQGEYVAAIKTAGAGSAASLVLVGSMVGIQFLVNLVPP